MALAGDDDKRVAQQQHRLDLRRQVRRCATATSIAPRSSCSAASAPFSGVRRNVALAACRAKRRGEAPDQRDLGIFGHAGGEDAGALRRVEADAEIERRLDLLDRGRDQRRDLARARGRLHAGRGAHEQIVGEEAAQARQRVAHRRLRQADAAGGAGHGALADQRVEGFQQVEVDRSNIHATNE